MFNICNNDLPNNCRKGPARMIFIVVSTSFLDFEQIIVFLFFLTSQPTFTCSKLTIETLEQSVKYVQS